MARRPRGWLYMDVGNLAYTYGFIWDLIYDAVTPAAALDAVTPAAACTYIYTKCSNLANVLLAFCNLFGLIKASISKNKKKAYVCNIQSLKKLLLVSKELVNNGFSFWRTKEVNGPTLAQE